MVCSTRWRPTPGCASRSTARRRPWTTTSRSGRRTSSASRASSRQGGLPSVFAGTGPDGSTVRCEYLLGGYGNGRDVLSLPDRIGHKLDVYVRAQLPAFGDDEILAMYGEDHSLPLPGYAGHVAAFNGEQDRYELRIATLAEYVTAQRGRSLPERSWPGELR